VNVDKSWLAGECIWRTRVVLVYDHVMSSAYEPSIQKGLFCRSFLSRKMDWLVNRHQADQGRQNELRRDVGRV
jgi:hypothetical protein